MMVELEDGVAVLRSSTQRYELFGLLPFLFESVMISAPYRDDAFLKPTIRLT